MVYKNLEEAIRNSIEIQESYKRLKKVTSKQYADILLYNLKEDAIKQTHPNTLYIIWALDLNYKYVMESGKPINFPLSYHLVYLKHEAKKTIELIFNEIRKSLKIVCSIREFFFTLWYQYPHEGHFFNDNLKCKLCGHQARLMDDKYIKRCKEYFKNFGIPAEEAINNIKSNIGGKNEKDS